MKHKSVIKDEFNSAIEFIERGGISNFCHAILSLQAIVEFALNDFFDTYIHTFSKENLEKIKKCENKFNKNFDELELGRKMRFLRDSEFIENAGKNHNKYFVNILKLRDSEFVDLRNEAIHRLINTALNDEKYKVLITKINDEIEDSTNIENEKSLNTKKNLFIIDRDSTIKQYNLIADVLNELGFEGNYDYETTRYNRFYDYFRSINDKYINEFSLPFSCNYTIDSSLLSDFQCYNQLSGEFQSFNFIKDSKSVSSKCLTECNCLISGEGGIGKSTILHHIYEYCKNYNITFLRKPFEKASGHEDFCPIPIFISAHKFKISDDNPYDADDLKADISRQIDNSFSFFEETEKMARLYCGADNNKPFFIFLIDGLNETSYASNYIGTKILNILGEFIEIAEKRIQVIITSRTNLQSDKRFQSMFKEIKALGLGKENIIKYVETKNPSFKIDIISKLNNIKILDILKNPMLLTLYTGYKYDNEELKKFDQDIEILKKKSKLILRESNALCISDIFWNYIEYKVLFHNIFQPVIVMKTRQLTVPEERGLERKECEQNVYLKVISELIPQIAWELVSRDLFSIELSDKSIINIMGTFYKKNKANLYIKSKERAIDSFIEYMTNSVCLLKCEDEILSFHHQNFRDFFGACYYISEYTPLTGKSKKKIDKIRERLKNEYLSSNIKLFVGELLNERGTDLPESKIDMPLKEVLGEYKLGEESENLSDHTVENIFEIDKALDVLNPIDYFDLNIDRLNFSDVKADKMVAFVDKMLNNVSIDALMSEGVQNKIKKKLSFKHSADTKTADMLQNLFMLSARCASNSNMKYVEKYFDVWLRWARKLYKYKIGMPVKKLSSKPILNYVLEEDRVISFALGSLTNLLYSRLKNENIGIGEEGILSIFTEVSNSKSTYMSLMNVLTEPEKTKVSEVKKKIYDLASQGGLASNFVVLIINYYVFNSRENDFGEKLINGLVEQMNEEKEEEKKTYIRFRLMSGINFCLQESLLDKNFTQNDLEKFKSIYKQIMTDLLNDELNSFSNKTADDYRNFKYGYYFPFGILYEFDNGINENLVVRKIIDKIFSEEQINYNLFQKLIFDVACCSTNTFFAQNLEYYEDKSENDSSSSTHRLYGCKYLENTYKLFTTLIYRLYPVQQTSSLYEHEEIWTSLTEALGILYYNFPLNTEDFFDSIKAHYPENRKICENHSIWDLKRESANAVNKKFEKLCQMKLRGNIFIIKGFIINYKNMWLFADLANNVFLTSELLRKSLVSWGENSFYKNIDIYKREPREFVKQTLKEVLSLLNKEVKFKEIIEV